jgi:hypothetical protein
MGFEPVADESVLAGVQHFPADAENDSTSEHDGEGIFVATEAEDDVSDHAKGSGDDEHPAGSDLVDQDASQQRDHHVGEGVEGVEEVKLELCYVISLFCQILLYRFLEGLG